MKTKFLTLSNFESRLDEMILSRGHDYIENVIDLKFKSNDQYNQWQGKVQGNEIYRVIIQAELATDGFGSIHAAVLLMVRSASIRLPCFTRSK